MTDHETHRWINIDPGDLEVGGVTTVVAGGRAIAITRTAAGYGALDNRCPHQGGPLGDGQIERGYVICPWHGWKYALTNGHCSTLPGSASAICYETRIVGHEVWARLVRTNPDA